MAPGLNAIPGPLSLPFWGNLHLFKIGKFNIGEYHKALEALYREYGPVVRMQYGPSSKTVVHLFDPEDAELVHTREGKMPYIRPLQDTVHHYREMRKTSPGLGNTNGEEWYRLRSAVRQVMLRPQGVQTYLPNVNEINDEFIARLKSRRNANGEVENLRSELSKLSREVAGWICFGRRLGSMDAGSGETLADRIIEANRIVFRLSAELKFSLPFYQYLATPAWRKLVAAEDIITNHGLELVEKAVQSLRAGKTADCQFLQYLLGKDELSDKDVSIITLSLFTDGLSTTVPTLMSILYCLASYPAIQEEVFDEIKNIAPNGEISASSLGRAQFLKAFVKEVFRMFPNGTETSRVIQSDHTVSGKYHLRAGTSVSLNQFVHFRSEKYFTEPDSFHPHRWLREGSTSSIHNFLLLPFGYGSRSCAGRRFAEQDLYVTIAKILYNFKLRIVPGGPPFKLIYETLLFPQEPVRISFQLREE